MSLPLMRHGNPIGKTNKFFTIFQNLKLNLVSQPDANAHCRASNAMCCVKAYGA